MRLSPRKDTIAGIAILQLPRTVDISVQIRCFSSLKWLVLNTAEILAIDFQKLIDALFN